MGVALGSTLLLSSCGLFVDQEAAADEFFSLLSTDVAAAYESSALEFKEITSLEALEAFIATYPETADVVGLSFDDRTVDEDYAELYGTVTYGDDWSESIGVYLYLTDEWRVGGFEMGL